MAAYKLIFEGDARKNLVKLARREHYTITALWVQERLRPFLTNPTSHLEVNLVNGRAGSMILTLSDDSERDMMETPTALTLSGQPDTLPAFIRYVFRWFILRNELLTITRVGDE